VLIIGSNRYCIGCFIGYPAGFIAIIAAIISVEFWGIPNQIFLNIGIILFLPIILSFTRWSSNKSLKIIQKLSLGISCGFIGVYVFYISPFHLILTIFLIEATLLVIMAPIFLFHRHNLKKTCASCPNPEFKCNNKRN
jgi:hypothetical protein